MGVILACEKTLGEPLPQRTWRRRAMHFREVLCKVIARTVELAGGLPLAIDLSEELGGIPATA
jgi:hypothetical protein